MRLLFNWLLKSLLLLCITNAYANNVDEKYVTSVAKAIQHVNKNPSAVWPNFQLNKYAIILLLVDHSVYNYYHTYAFQFTPKDTNWEQLNFQDMHVYFRNPSGLDNQLGFQIVEDQLAYVKGVILDIPEKSKDVTSALTRSLFKHYVYNASHFPQDAINLKKYIYNGFNEITNIAYINIEGAALKDYLINNDTEALKNYLAVHNTRLANLNDSSQKFEKALELSEGTASYVVLKSLNLSNKDYLDEVLSKPYCTFKKHQSDIIWCLTNIQYNFIDLALGYALDQVATPDWKNTVEMNGTPFSSLLNSYYPMSQSEITQRTEASKVHYQFDNITAALHKNIGDYLKDMQLQQEQYNRLEGYEITIDTRKCNTKFNDDMDEYYYLNSQLLLYTNFKARYFCDGDRYQMNVFYNYIPFVYINKNDGFETFKISPNTILIIDGNQETAHSFIQGNKKKTFYRLSIQNNQMSMNISGLGTLDGSNNKLVMTLADKKVSSKVTATRDL